MEQVHHEASCCWSSRPNGSRERNRLLFQLQQCQTKQTDGLLCRKPQQPSVRLGNTCRAHPWLPLTRCAVPPTPRITPARASGQGKRPIRTPASPRVCLCDTGGNNVQRQKQTSSPRTCIRQLHSTSTRLSISSPVPRSDSMRNHPIASIASPSSTFQPLLGGCLESRTHRASTGRVPSKSLDRCSTSLHPLHSDMMPRHSPSRTLPSKARR